MNFHGNDTTPTLIHDLGDKEEEENNDDGNKGKLKAETVKEVYWEATLCKFDLILDPGTDKATREKMEGETGFDARQLGHDLGIAYVAKKSSDSDQFHTHKGKIMTKRGKKMVSMEKQPNAIGDCLKNSCQRMMCPPREISAADFSNKQARAFIRHVMYLRRLWTSQPS